MQYKTLITFWILSVSRKIQKDIRCFCLKIKLWDALVCQNSPKRHSSYYVWHSFWKKTFPLTFPTNALVAGFACKLYVAATVRYSCPIFLLCVFWFLPFSVAFWFLIFALFSFDFILPFQLSFDFCSFRLSFDFCFFQLTFDFCSFQ